MQHFTDEHLVPNNPRSIHYNVNLIVTGSDYGIRTVAMEAVLRNCSKFFARRLDACMPPPPLYPEPPRKEIRLDEEDRDALLGALRVLHHYDQTWILRAKPGDIVGFSSMAHKYGLRKALKPFIELWFDRKFPKFCDHVQSPELAQLLQVANQFGNKIMFKYLSGRLITRYSGTYLDLDGRKDTGAKLDYKVCGKYLE